MLGFESFSAEGLYFTCFTFICALSLFYVSIKDSMKISVGDGMIKVSYWLYPFYHKEYNQKDYDCFYTEICWNQKWKYKKAWLVKDNILQERIGRRTISNFDDLLEAMEIPFKGQLNGNSWYKKGTEVRNDFLKKRKTPLIWQIIFCGVVCIGLDMLIFWLTSRMFGSNSIVTYIISGLYLCFLIYMCVHIHEEETLNE